MTSKNIFWRASKATGSLSLNTGAMKPVAGGGGWNAGADEIGSYRLVRSELLAIGTRRSVKQVADGMRNAKICEQCNARFAIERGVCRHCNLAAHYLGKKRVREAKSVDRLGRQTNG
jgi:ribosomal protein L40E